MQQRAAEKEEEEGEIILSTQNPQANYPAIVKGTADKRFQKKQIAIAFAISFTGNGNGAATATDRKKNGNNQ